MGPAGHHLAGRSGFKHQCWLKAGGRWKNKLMANEWKLLICWWNNTNRERDRERVTGRERERDLRALNSSYFSLLTCLSVCLSACQSICRLVCLFSFVCSCSVALKDLNCSFSHNLSSLLHIEASFGVCAHVCKARHVCLVCLQVCLNICVHASFSMWPCV